MGEISSTVSIPLFDPAQGTVIRKPDSLGAGHWVGAPYVSYDPQTSEYYLYYRKRQPRPFRGGEVCIAVGTDGVNFSDVVSITKETLGSQSIEKSSVLRCPDGMIRLYISYVDPATNKWRIDVMEAKTLEDLNTAKPQGVFTAEQIQAEGVKDPFVQIIDGTYFMIASYAEIVKESDEELQTKMHSTGDVYNTDTTTLPSGWAVSQDGVHWTWMGRNLNVSVRGWDRYQARINSWIHWNNQYVAFYDGSSSAAENYEERCGLAMGPNLAKFDTISPDGPVVTSPYASGSVRYVHVMSRDNALWYYYEFCRSDGSHDLRVSVVSVG